MPTILALDSAPMILYLEFAAGLCLSKLIQTPGVEALSPDSGFERRKVGSGLGSFDRLVAVDGPMGPGYQLGASAGGFT